ncbi:MAG: hypothetical protein ACON4T_06125 [Synechococcus sp.]
MTASSAPVLQRRREALRQYLLDARARADERAIACAEQRWVHRYGVHSLPRPETPVDAASAGESVQYLDRDHLKSAWQGRPMDCSVQHPVQVVPPPPSPQLHHLRRWLSTTTATDTLPQAS